jgi:hypothetical protein
MTTFGRMDVSSFPGKKERGIYILCWIRWTELFPMCGFQVLHFVAYIYQKYFYLREIILKLQGQSEPE